MRPVFFLKQFTLWILLLALSNTLAANLAAPDLGARPPFQTYTPDIEVYPQNFAVAEDHKGNIYLGNNDGVIQFDGKRWTLTTLPNGDIVRSLAGDNAGRIYVGGYDEFGYLETDPRGQLIYHDLKSKFDKDLDGALFADIWDVVVADHGVYFKALNDLFFWDPNTRNTRYLHWPGRFGAITEHNGALYLQFRGEGFRQWVNQQWQPLPNTQSLTDLVGDLVPLPDGDFLTIERGGDWHRFSADGVTPFEMPADMPRSSKFTNGVQLDDRTLAFSSDMGMIYLLDLTNNSLRKVNLGEGFLSDLKVTSNGNLLTTDDSALYHVPWPAEWKIMDRLNGLRGSVFKLQEHGQALYALTGSGVYRKPNNSDQFERMPWLEHENWDMVPLSDNDSDDDSNYDSNYDKNKEMILADSYQLHLVAGDTVTPLHENVIYPRVLLRSRFNSDLIYVGTEHGIALLALEAGTWKLKYHNGDMQNLRVTSMVETAENELVIGSERGGIQRINFTLDESWRSQATKIGSDAGIQYGEQLDAMVTANRNGKLLVSTRAGFFLESSGKFLPTFRSLHKLKPKDEMVFLAPDAYGLFWGYTFNSLFQQTENGTWQQSNIGNVRKGAINTLYFSEAGGVQVGANASIMVHDARPKAANSNRKKVTLKDVEVRSASGETRHLLLDEPAEIEKGEPVTFRYALPDLVDPEKVQYRARLLPIEPDFGDWTTTAEYTYYGLGPAEHQFEVEALDTNGQHSTIAPFTLTVMPSWYEHNLFRALIVVLGVIGVVIINIALGRARSRKLAEENANLELMVVERTRELASANRQLESLAHLDGLTSIPNRRRLDAYLEEVWQQCIERDRTMAVAMLDIDHFKQYNDTHGHPAGDALLKQLAQLLSHSLRRGEDLVARYGGEEFLVVLPGADEAAALIVAESMRSNVENSSLAVTVSVGVATSDKLQTQKVEELIETADKALYAAKNQGRNKVLGSAR